MKRKVKMYTIEVEVNEVEVVNTKVSAAEYLRQLNKLLDVAVNGDFVFGVHNEFTVFNQGMKEYEHEHYTETVMQFCIGSAHILLTEKKTKEGYTFTK